MKRVCFILIFASVPVSAADAIKLRPGYVYKLRCQGRLLISSVGNDSLVRLEALPREAGCAALIKALGPAGVTNVLLETSTGTISRIFEVAPGNGAPPTEAALEISLISSTWMPRP